MWALVTLLVGGFVGFVLGDTKAKARANRAGPPRQTATVVTLPSRAPNCEKCELATLVDAIPRFERMKHTRHDRRKHHKRRKPANLAGGANEGVAG